MSGVLQLVDEIAFQPGRLFRWSPGELTIFFDPARIGSERGRFQLLHEIGHALLAHQEGTRGHARWKMERDAWDVAGILARRFDVSIDPALANQQLHDVRHLLAIGFYDRRR